MPVCALNALENVSERLKVTCFGETEINYKGNPEIDKGIVIGEAELRKIG